MKDEELAKINLPHCWRCGSHITSVRYAGDGWYYVGCVDCDNKRTCDEKYLQETIDYWCQLALRFGRNM